MSRPSKAAATLSAPLASSRLPSASSSNAYTPTTTASTASSAGSVSTRLSAVFKGDVTRQLSGGRWLSGATYPPDDVFVPPMLTRMCPGKFARMTDDALRRSPLHDRHADLGAKFAPFGGWEMPLEYAGGGRAPRAHGGPRGGRRLRRLAPGQGPGDAARARPTSSTPASPTTSGRIGSGQAQYTLCCDDATGGVVDDVIAYRYADDHVFLVPNAANTTEVVRRLRAAAPQGIDGHERARGVRDPRGAGPPFGGRRWAPSACPPTTTT